MSKFIEFVKKYQTPITAVTVGLVAIGSGIGIGYGIKAAIGGGPNTDYSGIHVTEVDVNAVMRRYERLSADTDYSKSFTIPEIVAISHHLLGQADNYVVQGIGTADAGIAMQEIRSMVIKNGDEYFEESLSQSLFVKDALRMYEVGNLTTQYRGSTTTSVEVAEFPSAGVSYTNAEYVELMGRTVSSRNTYIVANETVLMGEKTGEMYGTSSITKTSTGYDLEIELDPIAGVMNYVKQMKTISNLATYPSFFYTHLSYKLDSNLNPLSMTTHERYSAKLSSGIGSYITASIESKYLKGQELAIPEVNTPLSYVY